MKSCFFAEPVRSIHRFRINILILQTSNDFTLQAFPLIFCTVLLTTTFLIEIRTSIITANASTSYRFLLSMLHVRPSLREYMQCDFILCLYIFRTLVSHHRLICNLGYLEKGGMAVVLCVLFLFYSVFFLLRFSVFSAFVRGEKICKLPSFIINLSHASVNPRVHRL